MHGPSVGEAICHSRPHVQCLGTEKITCHPVLKSVTLAFRSVHTGFGGLTQGSFTHNTWMPDLPIIERSIFLMPVTFAS